MKNVDDKESPLDKTTVYLRRKRDTYQNDLGKWPESEKTAKEINVQAKLIEDQVSALYDSCKILDDLCLKAFNETPEVDSLFYDSPISPNKMSFFLRSALRKAGFSFVRDITKVPIEIEPFSVAVKDGTRWLLKLKPRK